MRGGDAPEVDDYDLVVVLGGARRAPIDRCRYAHQVLMDRNVLSIALLGSGRGLADDEASIVADYARARAPSSIS